MCSSCTHAHHLSVYAAAEAKVPKEPTGLLGDGAIVFGGGAVFNKQNKELMDASDPAQLAATK